MIAVRRSPVARFWVASAVVPSQIPSFTRVTLVTYLSKRLSIEVPIVLHEPARVSSWLGFQDSI
ncbi:hypothetical protein W823_24275 [Williamsia sp. D3]|nr:hypothetical protein W823_24275 [Williamsia sp. D3]